MNLKGRVLQSTVCQQIRGYESCDVSNSSDGRPTSCGGPGVCVGVWLTFQTRAAGMEVSFTVTHTLNVACLLLKQKNNHLLVYMKYFVTQSLIKFDPWLLLARVSSGLLKALNVND